MAAATTTPITEEPTPGGILAAVRAEQATLAQAEIRKMQR